MRLCVVQVVFESKSGAAGRTLRRGAALLIPNAAIDIQKERTIIGARRR